MIPRFRGRATSRAPSTDVRNSAMRRPAALQSRATCSPSDPYLILASAGLLVAPLSRQTAHSDPLFIAGQRVLGRYTFHSGCVQREAPLRAVAPVHAREEIDQPLRVHRPFVQPPTHGISCSDRKEGVRTPTRTVFRQTQAAPPAIFICAQLPALVTRGDLKTMPCLTSPKRLLYEVRVAHIGPLHTSCCPVFHCLLIYWLDLRTCHRPEQDWRPQWPKKNTHP